MLHRRAVAAAVSIFDRSKKYDSVTYGICLKCILNINLRRRCGEFVMNANQVATR